MRLNTERIFVFILFSAIISSNFLTSLVLADENTQNINTTEIIVTHDRTLQEFIANDSTNNTYPSISFWQLPLWVQIAYISFTITTIAVVIKGVPFLFGRLNHALENPKTKEIFHFIQRNPGITIAELSKEQNINRGTLKYHLGQLLVNNKIMFIKKGKFLHLFYNNSHAIDKESLISARLKNDKDKAFLFTIMDNPGITNQDLSQKFDLDKSTVSDYLKKFLDDGMIEYRQDGKFKRCYILQDTRMILLRHKLK